MKSKVTLQSALSYLKIAVMPLCWPLINGNSTWVLLNNLWFFLGVTLLLSNVTASLAAIFLNRHDTIRAIKQSAEFSSMFSAMVKTIICKIVAPKLVAVLLELETFMNQANSEEKELVQYYVDKCLFVHAFTVASAVFGGTSFILAPVFLPSQFLLPGDAAYPFVIERFNLGWACLFVTQSCNTVQVVVKVILDVFYATLMWYTAVRFRMLALELGKATEPHEIRLCAKKHQELLTHTEKITSIVRIIAVEVTFAAMLTIICGGFVLTRNPSLIDVIKYGFYEIGALMELLMYTWAAGNLMDASEDIADAAFNCDWIGKSPQMLKDLLIITQRSRKPIIIAYNGILPTLSLEYYGSTMAATFSYLTTLRAMTEG